MSCNDYLKGFRAGMSVDQKNPQTFMFMGRNMEQLIELIKKDEEEKFKYMNEIGRIFGVDYLYVEGQLKKLGYEIKKINPST